MTDLGLAQQMQRLRQMVQKLQAMLEAHPHILSEIKQIQERQEHMKTQISKLIILIENYRQQKNKMVAK